MLNIQQLFQESMTIILTVEKIDYGTSMGIQAGSIFVETDCFDIRIHFQTSQPLLTLSSDKVYVTKSAKSCDQPSIWGHCEILQQKQRILVLQIEKTVTQKIKMYENSLSYL